MNKLEGEFAFHERFFCVVTEKIAGYSKSDDSKKIIIIN